MKKPPKQIRIEGEIAYIPLTKGYEAVIDADYASIAAKYNWFSKPDGKRVYAARGEYKGNGRSKTIYLHRDISCAQKGMEVDHINGDGLDNRKSNLRLATKSQNLCNQSAPAHNTSGLKGVSFCKKRKKWIAQICVNRKTRKLGSYELPEDAHKAYCKASIELHGEFGRF
jgi:HNH endonuclease/AP2 domain